MNKTKLRRKKLTINDLLCQDNVNELLTDLEERKPDIIHAIIIYETKDGIQTWRMTDEMRVSECVGLIEVIKARIIEQATEEDDDN